MDEVPVFIALGANLGEPEAQIVEAVERLATVGLRPVARSRLYRSAPIGPPGQPDYLNAAVEVRTSISPEAVLAKTQSIEQAMGRIKTVRWGPRVVDIDIALYGGQTIDTPDLTVPHRELANRRFVLAPLADLDSDRVVPGANRTIGELLRALGPDDGTLTVFKTAW